MGEQQTATNAPVKRGPGRPRRHPVEAATPAAAPVVVVDDGVRVVNLRGAADIIGKSESTIKRLVKNDSTFPKPFEILNSPNNLLVRDIKRWLLRKAGHPVDPA